MVIPGSFRCTHTRRRGFSISLKENFSDKEKILSYRAIMFSWEEIWLFIKDWYWVPFVLVYTAIIITILSENRTPSKSLAYILVLIFLPVVGIIIYIMVGRKPVFKKISFGKKRIRDRKKMELYFKKIEPLMQQRLGLLEHKIGDLALPFNYLYRQKESLISTNNSVKLLNNGEEKFPELYRALENATSYIHIEYYIFSYDDVGNAVTDILIRKKKEGVDVRIIVDDVGSNKMGNIPNRLKESGITLLRTQPVTFTSLANSNYRNHRKIVIIDGKTGFIGGINLDDRYLNNGKHKLYWRDTAVRIDGNAVKILEVHFFLSWLFSGGEDNFPAVDQAILNTDYSTSRNAIVAFAASGPASEVPCIMEAILVAISQAKKSIRICTPYFIPNDPLTSALVIAASTGIEVEIILPEKSDSYIVQHASASFIKPLLQRGVYVYLYQKGFMHSKTISIDGKLAFIGTVNMDTRSFLLNFEITSLIYDEELCSQIEHSFEIDKNNSELITLENWQKRPSVYRGFDSVCRLLAPLL